MQKDIFKEVAQEYSLSPCHIDILFAQALLESGHFTSNIYQNANNAFGMKQPRVRDTLSIGEFPTATGNYAKFSSLKDSIKDRLLWDAHFNIEPPACGGDVDRYLSDVQSKGYAEDPAYITKVLALRGKLEHEIPFTHVETQSNLSPIWLLALIGVAAFIFFKKKSQSKGVGDNVVKEDSQIVDVIVKIIGTIIDVVKNVLKGIGGILGGDKFK